jgi:hypothetical protein
MFIPLKMVLIGIDPYPYSKTIPNAHIFSLHINMYQKHIIICCPLGPWVPRKSLGPSSSYSPPRCYRYRSHSSAGPNYRLYDIGHTMVYHMNEVNHGKNHGKPKFINHPKLGFMKLGI